MSLEKENKRLREQLEEANKLAATLALLLDEAYNELGVDSGKEVGKPMPEEFEAFCVDCTREEYPEVKEILESQGYELKYVEWVQGEDCVATNKQGYYMTYSMRDNQDYEPVYTLPQLREKYGLTT